MPVAAERLHNFHSYSTSSDKAPTPSNLPSARTVPWHSAFTRRTSDRDLSEMTVNGVPSRATKALVRLQMIGHPANLYRSQSQHSQPYAVVQTATVISWLAKRIMMDASATLHLSLTGNSRLLHMPAPRTELQVRPALCNPAARTPTCALTGARSPPGFTLMSVVTSSYHPWSARPWASVPSRDYKILTCLASATYSMASLRDFQPRHRTNLLEKNDLFLVASVWPEHSSPSRGRPLTELPQAKRILHVSPRNLKQSRLRGKRRCQAFSRGRRQC